MFRSIVEFQAAINCSSEDANPDAKPFDWTAHPNNFMAAVKRGREVLDLIY